MSFLHVAPSARILPARVVVRNAFGGTTVVIPDFELRRHRFLRLDENRVAFHAPALALHQRKRTRLGAGHDRAERIVRVGELLVSDSGDTAFPLFGNRLVAEHHTEHARGAGRIAVGVLAGARGDFQRLAEIAFAIEQAQRDVGAVEFGVDVEGLQRAIRARFAFVVLVFDQLPGLSPIAGILFGPGEQVRDQQAVRTLGGNCLEARFHHFARIAFEECRRVHAGNEHAAVKTVAVVHDAARVIGDAVGGARHAGSHQADEVGFDLEIDVVGVRVVFGRAGERAGNAALKRAPRGQVGVPETVLGIAKRHAKIVGSGVEPFIVEHLGQRHVDVEIVLAERVRHAVRGPLGQFAFEYLRLRAEFGRCAVAHANHLAGPSALDLVAQLVESHTPDAGLLRERGREHGQQDSTHRDQKARHEFIPPRNYYSASTTQRNPTVRERSLLGAINRYLPCSFNL